MQPGVQCVINVRIIRSYVMWSRGISWKSNMWRFQFSIYLIEVLIRRGTLCLNPPEYWASGSKVISIEKILKTIENKRNAFLLLDVPHNQCSWLPTDPTRSQHIWSSQYLLGKERKKNICLPFHETKNQVFFLSETAAAL